jgi:hypothetical protein
VLHPTLLFTMRGPAGTPSPGPRRLMTAKGDDSEGLEMTGWKGFSATCGRRE